MEGETGTAGPDALNGLTSAAYSDVIRRDVDTTPSVNVEAWWAATAKVTQERDEAREEIALMAADLLAKDATIERLWRQLNEAANVPDHNDPEFGFDKTAALSEPDECDCDRLPDGRHECELMP